MLKEWDSYHALVHSGRTLMALAVERVMVQKLMELRFHLLAETSALQ